MLNTENQAHAIVGMLEANNFAFGEYHFEFDEKHRSQLISILETELSFAKKQGELEFKEKILKEFSELLDMASNYDYLKSKSNKIKKILGLED